MHVGKSNVCIKKFRGDDPHGLAGLADDATSYPHGLAMLVEIDGETSYHRRLGVTVGTVVISTSLSYSELTVIEIFITSSNRYCGLPLSDQW